MYLHVSHHFGKRPMTCHQQQCSTAPCQKNNSGVVPCSHVSSAHGHGFWKHAIQAALRRKMHVHAYTHRISAALLVHNTRCRCLSQKKIFPTPSAYPACPFAHPSLGPFAASGDIITRIPQSHRPGHHFSVIVAYLRLGPKALLRLHTPGRLFCMWKAVTAGNSRLVSGRRTTAGFFFSRQRNHRQASQGLVATRCGALYWGFGANASVVDFLSFTVACLQPYYSL